MKRALYLLLALSLGLNAGLLYMRYAARPPRDARPGPPPQERAAPRHEAEAVVKEHLDAISRRLELTGEQQAAIRSILEAQMPGMTGLRRRTTEANRRIGEAFAAPEFDAARFQQLVRDASAARARVDSLSAVMLLGEAALLTREQRAKFAEAAPTIYSNPQPAPPPHGSQRPDEDQRPAGDRRPAPPRPDQDPNRPPPPGH